MSRGRTIIRILVICACTKMAPVAFSATTVIGTPTLLFDVNFESPGDRLDQPAARSFSPNAAGVFDHPSGQVYGTTVIVGGIGASTSQAARFVPSLGTEFQDSR